MINIINSLKRKQKEGKSNNDLPENKISSEEIFNTLSGITNHSIPELSESEIEELSEKLKNSMADAIMLIRDINEKLENLTVDRAFLNTLLEGGLAIAEYILDESKKINERTGKTMAIFEDASSAYEEMKKEMKKSILLGTDIGETIKKRTKGDFIIDDIKRKIKSSVKSNEHMIEQREFLKRWKEKSGTIIKRSKEQENYLLEQRKELKEQIKFLIDNSKKIFKLAEEVEKYRKWRIFRKKGSFNSVKFYVNEGFYMGYLGEIKKIYESYLNS